MVASHTPPMRPGRGREAPPGRQGGSGVPGGVSGPRRSTGGTRARSGGGLGRRLAPLIRGRGLPKKNTPGTRMEIQTWRSAIADLKPSPPGAPSGALGEGTPGWVWRCGEAISRYKEKSMPLCTFFNA